MPTIRSVIVHMDIPPTDLGLPDDLRPLRAHASYEGADAFDQAAVALGQWSPGISTEALAVALGDLGAADGRDLTASELLGTVAHIRAELRGLLAGRDLALGAAAAVAADYEGALPQTLADLGAWTRRGAYRRRQGTKRLARLLGRPDTASLGLVEAAALEIERLRAVVAAGGGVDFRPGLVIRRGDVPAFWAYRGVSGVRVTDAQKWSVAIWESDLRAPRLGAGSWSSTPPTMGDDACTLVAPIPPDLVARAKAGDEDAGRRVAALALGRDLAGAGGSTSRRVVAVGDVLPLGEVPPGWVVRPQDGAEMRWLVGEGRDGVGVVSVTRRDLTVPDFSWGVWVRVDDWGAGRQVEVVAGPLTPAQVLAIVEGDADAGKRLARLAWGEADAADGLPVSPSAAPAPSVGEVRAIEDVPPGWIVGVSPDGNWAADRRVLVGDLGRIPVLLSDQERPSFWPAQWGSAWYVPTGERVELLAPVPAQVIAAAVAGDLEAGRTIGRRAYRPLGRAVRTERPAGC